jgi:hypothetical protein
MRTRRKGNTAVATRRLRASTNADDRWKWVPSRCPARRVAGFHPAVRAPDSRRKGHRTLVKSDSIESNDVEINYAQLVAQIRALYALTLSLSELDLTETE